MGFGTWWVPRRISWLNPGARAFPLPVRIFRLRQSLLEQRRLEIARALATQPRLLILDEPAGGMNEQETEALIGLIGRIKARGITILLIEHDMRLVMRVCEKLVVLEYGSKIADGKSPFF